jgi:hypothetical protein
VGKKKDKEKHKSKDDNRLGREELTLEVERLQLENDGLRARLERISEIASTPLKELETP